MKSLILIMVALFGAFAAFPPVLAQTYNIGWFTVDGGGGTTAGGVYSVSGTIGQPDAGHMSGGNLSFDSGFWAFSGMPVGTGPLGANLIVNGDAESGLGSPSGNDVLPAPGWTQSGNFTVAAYGALSGVRSDVPGPAARGVNYFAGGPDTALSSATQLIDVSAAAVRIDAGAVTAKLTGYLGGVLSQNDNASLRATFLGAAANSLGEISIGPVLGDERAGVTSLLLRGVTNSVPAGTRQIQLALTMTRTEGSYNDAYADNLSLVLVAGPYFNPLPPMPDGILGVSYTQPITSLGGVAPVTHTISNGALPAGMTLSLAGVLSGIPTAAGPFDFVVRATDATGLSAEQPCALRIVAPALAPSGLLAWWRGENNALDSAGANNGTLINGATFAAGKVGQAFSLDGADDRVAIPEAVGSDLSRLPAWTIEAWVRPTSFAQTYPTIYSEGRWIASLGLNQGTGKLETWINNRSVFQSTVALQLGIWSHVACTHDAGIHTFYINGIATGSFTTPPVLPDDNGAAIGDVPYSPNSSTLQGQIDELSLYNRALTAAEIASIYNADFAGKQTLAIPGLSLHFTPKNLLLSWPSSLTGVTLHQNTDLSPFNWLPVTNAVNDDGATKSILVVPGAGRRFYRLNP